MDADIPTAKTEIFLIIIMLMDKFLLKKNTYCQVTYNHLVGILYHPK